MRPKLRNKKKITFTETKFESLALDNEPGGSV